MTFARAEAASVAVIPASATLSPGQSLFFSAAVVGGVNAGVSWTMSPAIGSLSNGYYRAPSTISSPQTVVLTATSLSGGLTGSAVVSLMPFVAPPPVVSSGPLSITPPTASVSSGQSISFSALYNGNATNQVNWTISPAIGSINNGVYQAPVAIANTQAVTIQAVSFMDSTIFATATVTLVGANGGPALGAGSVFVIPSSATLTAGQAIFFEAGVTGAANSGVSWSLSPAVGTINNGYYQAPSYIGNSQTVTLTATSLGNPSLRSSVPIFLVGALSGPSTPIIPAPSPAPSSVAPVTTSMQLSPTSVSLMAQQTALFTVSTTGGLSTAATWSVVPSIGTISNGVYTAPASIATLTTITVMATSTSDPTKTASAAVTLQPSGAPPASVSIALSPSSVTLSSGVSTQFTASVSGTNNTSVTWSVSPSLGTISFGQYTAPAVIANQQVVTVTATSSADPTKSASSIVMLMPSSVTVSPLTISLGAGKSVQFSASVQGGSSSAVTWSIAPALGSISNGLYIAPSTVSVAQNVIVTATSVADPTKSAQATVSLTASAPSGITVSPGSATLSASQGQQFSAASTGLGGGGLASVQWSLNPAVGSITSGGFYTAPSSISAQQTVVVTATSGGVSASANVTLTPPASQPPSSPTPPAQQTSTITLPLEVIGPDGMTVGASFTVASGANLGGGTTLSMQIHGLRYDSQASVQVNGSGWLPISNSTVNFQGNGGAFGGIGGGFHTLQMTIPLAANVVTTGSNTITFRFNGTDGNSSGFRVLAFNIVDGSGNQLIPSSTFVWDDPNAWQPPSSAASDIAAGLALYQGAALTAPVPGGSPQTIQAHCSDCHAVTGRDLKYFNYSNNSIQARAIFHGLTAQQGSQIASYIRSLNVPNPGRPWNPPYQPGPGMDSQPVANWSAGAGLTAVLDNDNEMAPYLMPGGSTAGWSANSYLNPRELPVDLQLPDWNSWLPTIHPVDAFGSNFTGSALNTDYSQIRAALQPDSTTAYNAALQIWPYWLGAAGTFLAPAEANGGTNGWTSNLRASVYSVAQWQMVKSWELNQDFGLEAMAQVPYGAKANPRGWVGNAPFFTSPNMLHITAGPGIGNGSAVAQGYLAFVWYQLQLVLNDGQGSQTDHEPIDYGYVSGMLRNLYSVDANNMPGINLELSWLVKSLQEFTLTGAPPSATGGWNPTATSMEPLMDINWMGLWSATSPSTQTTLIQAYTQAWFNQASQYSPAQYYSTGGASLTDIPANDFFETTFGGQIWYSIPRLAFFGVSPTLVNQIGAWAATIWPAVNWNIVLTATCTDVNHCTSGY